MVHIIAYTFEADFHCIDCTLAYVRRNYPTYRGEDVVVVFHNGQMGVGLFLKNGDVIDSPLLHDHEHNELHPVFSTDETDPDGEWCGGCHKQLAAPYSV